MFPSRLLAVYPMEPQLLDAVAFLHVIVMCIALLRVEIVFLIFIFLSSLLRR